MTQLDAEKCLSEILATLLGSPAQKCHLPYGSPVWALAIADALNAAKEKQPALLPCKVKAINAAIALGCTARWHAAPDSHPHLLLSAPMGGVASFHVLVDEVRKIDPPVTDYQTEPWSAVARHPYAVHALTDPKLFVLLAEHTKSGKNGQENINSFNGAIQAHKDWRYIPTKA